MPIYEYECARCKRISNFLVRSITAHKPPACPKCGHPEMRRALSRFATVTSAKKTTKAADPPPALGAAGDDSGDLPDMSMLEGLDENDPRSMGRVMRQMAEQTGEPLDPEMDEVCRRLESGEDPEKIEEQMGDLEAGEGSGGSGGRDDTLYEG